MIYLTGDVHGTIDFSKLIGFHDNRKNKPCSKNDYLVILGDFGLVWYNEPKPGQQKPAHYQKYEKLLDRLSSWGWITLVIDGNHENHPRLLSYPEIDMFDNKVGKIRDNIYHLKRGRVYTIEGKKVFTFGGGLSIDKDQRLEGIDWWREELPSTMEMDAALGELERHNNKVDYIWTHEAPRQYVPLILGHIDERLPESMKYKSPLAVFFEHIHEIISFKQWFCAHYHEEFQKDKLIVLYKKIIELKV